MKLYKDGLVKEISKEKTIARLKREGWVDGQAEVSEESSQEPKRRGRPAKVVDNGND